MRDAEIRAFLTELYEIGQQNDTQEQERGKKMLNSGTRDGSVSAYIDQQQSSHTDP